MKEIIFNKPEMKSRRKALRSNATDEERLLWSYIKHSSVSVAKFRRQHSVGYYILDFYCPEIKLAIELDGSQHYSADGLEYDKFRDEYLKSLNIKTLRFSNSDVKRNLHGVLEMIRCEIENRRKITTPQPQPISGGGGRSTTPQPQLISGGGGRSTTPKPPPYLGGGAGEATTIQTPVSERVERPKSPSLAKEGEKGGGRHV